MVTGLEGFTACVVKFCIMERNVMIEKFIKVFVIILFCLVTYWLVVIIHETGHLCMGKVSGYSLGFFRIGSFCLVKRDGKWRLMREAGAPGTLGQCVMVPPESDNPEKVPAVLYHLGGGLFNLLTGGVVLPLTAVVDNKYLKAFFLLLGAISLGFALLNLLPFKFSFPNDGYNVKLLRKCAADRRAIYHIERITGNGQQSLLEMPEKEFEYSEEGEYSQVMKLMRGCYLLDCGKMQEAEALFVDCARKNEKNMPYYRMEAGTELLYCLVLRGAPKEEIEEVYNDELNQYLKSAKRYSIGKHRVLYAYNRLFLGEEEAAAKELALTEKLLAKNLLKGEEKRERALLQRVDECMKAV